MKNTKENTRQGKSGPNVETPEPPQVKNPSEHPSKQYPKTDKKQENKKPSKRGKEGGEELTPNEEL